MMKRYIVAILAIIGLVSTAKADTSKLKTADGWTKITTLPSATDIANNYYVFVDNSQDLMLGIGKGVHQDTKWYSLGVYYQNSVEPTSADINGKTWIVETSGSGFSLRNLEYSAQPMMTEWNAAWKYDTNDVYQPDGNWTVTLWAYADGSWTIQNGKYPDSGYLGPWDNVINNGAECAANKTGNNVGHFQIYAINRTQFQQNLIDNASATNPVDLTPWYVNNATFDDNNITGWTAEGSDNNFNYDKTGCEIWHRSNFKIYQTMTVPNGNFKVSVQATGSTSGTLYGTSGSTTKTASATVGNKDNYQNSVLEMIKDRNYGRITTEEITVSNSSLTIGFKDETTDQWDVFDNFKLYCTGVDLSAYVDQLAGVVSECNTFISSNVVPDACETTISNAITTYNKSYETGKQYSTAIVALTNVLNTYKNDTELQAAYASFNTFKTKVVGLTTGQSSSEALTTFNTAVTNATNAVEAATTAAAITAQIPNLRSAALTYISSVEGQFNITFLASQVYSDWKKKDGSEAGIVADQYLTNRPNTIPSFAESYETTCETTGTVLYQTISDLPAGYYQVGMYAAAMYTSGRGFTTEATEGDANRTYAFAGDRNDAGSIMRTGAPISFAGERNFTDLTTLDVNVHLSSAGDLTFGVQKDANGSNWHFAQIMTIIYSKSPDLTQLKATRDALVAEATGLKNGADAEMLTSAQKTALQSAITAGNNANDFDALNTVTLTTLPNAINTANQQIQQVKANRVLMIAALERFENDYNLTDGTDYRRATMSADAWTTLLSKVNAVTTALDDVELSSEYTTRKNALVTQMDDTDASLRLFKSYKAMVEGVTGVVGSSAASAYSTDGNMDTDATQQTAITALNTAFVDYASTQNNDINMAAFLGENLDFNTAQGTMISGKGNGVDDGNYGIFDLTGWEEIYKDYDNNYYLQTANSKANGKLYIRSNWEDCHPTLKVVKQRMLPVGKYRLSFKWNSNMNNYTNHSAYKLGESSTAIGEATTEEKTLKYNFEITESATPFELVFGFYRSSTGNNAAEIQVDDVELTYFKPTLNLADNGTDADNNSILLSDRNGLTFDVTLQGRTLYKDNSWNTLCLPFNLSAEQVTSILAPATKGLMELDTEGTYDGHKTGLDGTKLYLFFKEATSISAGVPYIIKWESGSNLTNPTFNGVTVSSGSPAGITSNDGAVTFQGTYAPAALTAGYPTNLYLAANNGLYYPKSDGFKVNAFRAYFLLSEPASQSAREFVVRFGEDDETTAVHNSRLTIHGSDNDTLYDLQGRRINAKAKPGLYISNGKKVVIK